jgi:hypothetical protein
VQDEISGRMGISFQRPFSLFHESPDRHAYRYEGKHSPTLPEAVRENSPPDRSRIGKWRQPKHWHRIREQFTRHPELFQILREDGYEIDDSWFDSYRPEAEVASK